MSSHCGYLNLASTAVVLSEHLPRPGIRTPDLPVLSPKVLSIRPPRHPLYACTYISSAYEGYFTSCDDDHSS